MARRARLVTSESSTARALAVAVSLSLISGIGAYIISTEPAPAAEAAGPNELIPPLNIEKIGQQEWEAEPRVLDDTINHHEVEARKEAIRIWEAEIARQKAEKRRLQDEKDRKEAAARAAATASRSGTRTNYTPSGRGGTPAENRALGQEMAAARGWTGSQWQCLDTLWGAKESGWNQYADNPRSSAYGIPQALPGSKMGPGWEHDPVVQIRWGLNYIANRYGTPCGALAARNSKGWY